MIAKPHEVRNSVDPNFSLYLERPSVIPRQSVLRVAAIVIKLTISVGGQHLCFQYGVGCRLLTVLSIAVLYTTGKVWGLVV